MISKQEIHIIVYDGENPAFIGHQNGSTTFYRLKKLTKDEIATLLSELNK